MRNYWIPGRNGTVPHYWREIANRNAQRRVALEGLSASLRESLAVLDDARQKAGDMQELVDPYHPELGLRWRQGSRLWRAARSRFAERLAPTPGVIRG